MLLTNEFSANRHSSAVRFDKLINDIFGVGHISVSRDTSEDVYYSPSIDAYQNDNAFIFHIDVPGVENSDISLSYDSGVLEIEAERKSHEDETDTVLRQERYKKRFRRRFNIGEDIDENAIEAKLNNGVLSVAVPKKIPQQPEIKKIEIK